MNVSQVLHVSQKKLRSYKTKSLFLIVPVALLLMGGIILNSLVANVQSATEKSIFGTIEEQGKLIEIQKASSQTGSGRFQRGITTSQDEFQESDIQKVEAVSGVDSADLLNTVPLGRVTTTTLVDGHTVTLPGVAGLATNLAGQYTDQDFSYTEGATIPIILSTNVITEQSEDWGGQDSISIAFGRRGQGGGAVTTEGPGTIGPVKTQSLAVTKDQLMGKTFTATIGGFDPVQDFTTTPSDSGVIFTKKSDAEIAAAEQARRDVISPYWDYDKLSADQTYTFKVAGVIDDGTSNGVYIPQTAARALMKNEITNQLSARTSTDIPVSTLNNTFTGTTYDGLTLSAPFSFGGRTFRFGGGQGGGRGGAVQNDTATTSYAIPGLVIQTERSTSDSNNPFDQGTVQGLYTDATVYDTAARSSTNMLVKVKSVDDRASVIAALNDAGYSYRDTQKLGVLTNLKNKLQLFTRVFTIAFIGLVALIFALALSRFISESRREIAIFRVIGATKIQIQQLVLGQAFIAALVSGVAGIGLGLLAVLVLAAPIHSWFSNLVAQSLGANYPKVTVVGTDVFRSIGWTGVGLYAGLLLLCTVVVGIVMSTVAARVSPAEGVRER
jgi:ABC-type antimicrobial peptide transport system permease subunit